MLKRLELPIKENLKFQSGNNKNRTTNTQDSFLPNAIENTDATNILGWRIWWNNKPNKENIPSNKKCCVQIMNFMPHKSPELNERCKVGHDCRKRHQNQRLKLLDCWTSESSQWVCHLFCRMYKASLSICVYEIKNRVMKNLSTILPSLSCRMISFHPTTFLTSLKAGELER